MKAQKFDNEKPRPELIPPHALMELAKLYQMGAKKYGDRNWEIALGTEDGLSEDRIRGAMMRHLLLSNMGIDLDEETQIDHLIAVAWNAFALWELKRRRDS